MKMPAFATAIVGAAASGASCTCALASSSASSSPSLFSSRGVAHMKSMAEMAKRRMAVMASRVHPTTSTAWGSSPMHKHGHRWHGLAFTAALPPAASSSMLLWPASSHPPRRRFAGDGKPKTLPWTPICETKLRMTPNYGTEGFRDAVRGGQDYTKPRGPERKSNGSSQQPQEHQQERNVMPPPPKTQPKQPQHQQQQPTENQPRRIPFPKLTPGRKRNYRPPHVAAALKLNAEMSGTVLSPAPTTKAREQDDHAAALNTADHIENFRDGKERTRYLNVVGPDGNAAPRDEVEPLPSPPMDTEPAPLVIVNGDADDAPDTRATAVEESHAARRDDDGEGGGSARSERFRDGPRPAAGRSGSDVVAAAPDDPFPAAPASAADGGGGGGAPQHSPLKPTHNSIYESLGPTSMNFRDGTRMATFKDDAFTVNVESAEESPFEDLLEESGHDDADDDSDDDDEGSEDYDESLLLRDTSDEDEMSVESMYQSIIDSDVPANPPSATQQQVRKPATAAAKTTSETMFLSSKPPLLSIDPKSIAIIPLIKGKAAEEGDDTREAQGETGLPDSRSPLSSGSLLNDPVRSHQWAGLSRTGSFVKMFRGSASYIANHRGTMAVYHIPGELLAWEGFPGLMDDIALTWLLGMKIVLVAGCRHQIDLRLEDLDGAEGYDGEGGAALGGRVLMSSIRVTDEETLRVVKEEAGFVRFEVERRLAKSLRMHGGLVKGSERLTGNVVSGNFYSAQPFGVVDGIDYCWTGFPRKVEVERIRQVHETNDIVLLTSLGVSPSGEIFNVNSEFLAATVAGSIGASKIIYFNVHGTSFQHKTTEKPVQNLRVSDAKNLLAHYKMRIHPKGFALVDLDGDSPQQSVTLRTPGSMETLIKVGYSMVALEHGVKRAHILAPENGALVQELYTRDGCGTLISRDIYDGIRRGDVNDVSGIYELCSPLVRSGILVERPKSELEKDILSYYVYTRDEMILATGQLKRFEGGFAEIGCLVVSKEYRQGGRGDAMLGYLERLAHQSGAKKVFVLSTQTMEWFVERGFQEVNVKSLPPSRQAVYNKKRNSKIYMKEIDDDRDLDAAELWWSNK